MLNRDSVALPPTAYPHDPVPDFFALKDPPVGSIPAMYGPQAGSIEFVTSYRFQLTTGAAVAKRTVSLTLQDETGRDYMVAVPASQQSGNTAVIYSFTVSVDSGFGIGDQFQVAPLFPLPLWPGWTIAPNCVNLDAGDQWFGTRGSVTRYSTGRPMVEPDPPSTVDLPMLPLAL